MAETAKHPMMDITPQMLAGDAAGALLYNLVTGFQNADVNWKPQPLSTVEEDAWSGRVYPYDQEAAPIQKVDQAPRASQADVRNTEPAGAVAASREATPVGALVEALKFGGGSVPKDELEKFLLQQAGVLRKQADTKFVPDQSNWEARIRQIVDSNKAQNFEPDLMSRVREGLVEWGKRTLEGGSALKGAGGIGTAVEAYRQKGQGMMDERRKERIANEMLVLGGAKEDFRSGQDVKRAGAEKAAAQLGADLPGLETRVTDAMNIRKHGRDMNREAFSQNAAAQRQAQHINAQFKLHEMDNAARIQQGAIRAALGGKPFQFPPTSAERIQSNVAKRMSELKNVKAGHGKDIGAILREEQAREMQLLFPHMASAAPGKLDITKLQYNDEN